MVRCKRLVSITIRHNRSEGRAYTHQNVNWNEVWWQMPTPPWFHPNFPRRRNGCSSPHTRAILPNLIPNEGQDNALSNGINGGRQTPPRQPTRQEMASTGDIFFLFVFLPQTERKNLGFFEMVRQPHTSVNAVILYCTCRLSTEEYEYARQKNQFYYVYLPFEPYVETCPSLYRFIEEKKQERDKNEKGTQTTMRTIMYVL